MTTASAASIPYEGADCTPEEAVEAVEAVRAAAGSVRDDEGWLLDQYGNRYGHCNSCGEEALADTECCDDGEVVPDGG